MIIDKNKTFMTRNTCNETLNFHTLQSLSIFLLEVLILHIIVHIDIHTLVVHVCAYNSCPFEYVVMHTFECQACI